MEWIREKIGFLLFFLLFVAMHLFGQGMHGGYDGFGEEEGQREHSAGSSPEEGRESFGIAS